MEHTMPFFLTVTQRIFSNWTALRVRVLAISNLALNFQKQILCLKMST